MKAHIGSQVLVCEKLLKSPEKLLYRIWRVGAYSSFLSFCSRTSRDCRWCLPVFFGVLQIKFNWSHSCI